MNFIISLYLLILSFYYQQPVDLSTKFHTKQLVVVTTDSWNNIEGRMSVYEHKGNYWEPVFTQIPIVTGRSGMAWGKGLHKEELNRGKLKTEGDGNSPAGIFQLSGLFGYEDILSKMSSLKVDIKTFCVDDSKSTYYNQIVTIDTVKKDWTSAETMRMKSDVYKFGIFVDYNVKPAIPTMGSCIFMHIWSGNTEPTAGCTAMKESDILKLIGFLDKKKNPILVQVPQSEYNKLKVVYKLP
jgi:L,D-peptidoglycan transpeptidase YkuD (ErfK/YbiS/YcfS/YnhG family)